MLVQEPFHRPTRRRPREDREKLNRFRLKLFLETSLALSEPVDEGFICTLNHILLQGFAEHREWAGFYRNKTVVVKENGRITYRPPGSERVPAMMKELVQVLNNPASASYVEHVARVFLELIEIHPFAEANGRTCRALATYLLLRAGFRERDGTSLEEFFDTDASRYVYTLNQAHAGNGAPWVEFFREAVENVMERQPS